MEIYVGDGTVVGISGALPAWEYSITQALPRDLPMVALGIGSNPSEDYASLLSSPVSG